MANPIVAVEPVAGTINEEVEIGATVFETLLATDPNGHLVPWLCESGSRRRRRTTLRADAAPRRPLLRRDAAVGGGVKRRSSRRSASAATLPAAFAAIQGVDEFRTGAAAEVAGIVARGEHDLEIQLDEPLPIYPSLLTEGSTAIAQPAPGDGPGLVGTGPFRARRRATPDAVVVERHHGYWRSGLPRLDAIEFRPGLTAAVIARRSALANSTSPATFCRRISTTSCASRAFAAGWSRPPKKNTYFVLFNCLPRTRGPRRSPCAVRSPESYVRAISSGARSAASRSRPRD